MVSSNEDPRRVFGTGQGRVFVISLFHMLGGSGNPFLGKDSPPPKCLYQNMSSFQQPGDLTATAHFPANRKCSHGVLAPRAVLLSVVKTVVVKPPELLGGTERS